MKLAVEFPSVAYREGPKAVGKLAKGIEDIGYDQLDVYDHVVMGYDIEGRTKSIYPAQMPIIEAFMMLSYAAAMTDKIGLGTEVLILPQRQPALVAKQVSSLDTLSDGRVRLGVGIGWQESEYEALGESFKTRGRRMDEAMELLRAYWREERIEFESEHYPTEAMAMEPKPPQGGDLPIWVGGNTPPAFRRVGKYGDGWLASQVSDADFAKRAMDVIREAAASAGRDPNTIGWQSMIAPPPRAGDTAGKTFYAEPARVAARVVELKEMGFDGVAVNATAIFQSGSRSVDAMLDALRAIHDRLRQEVG
ncbi:MAG: LLM class F420-dependent oxidoreductase [Alphaproteobacteria bacterium]|jgi:probable F420-dependent oxidoreductase|nr:LLM class F420-dependent oxidoreductase [Alphaproteobacteria bacterium]